jgi:hypothetical protein
MKKFRSTLAIATVATSITASCLPSQAVTWDEIWGAIKEGYEKVTQPPPPQPKGSNNEAQQQPASADSPTPQQNNYFEQSSTAPQPASQGIAVKCISANGRELERIDRDSPESNISVGRRVVLVDVKANLFFGSSYEKTCKILRHPASEKVRVGYAIPDNSTLTSARVIIYVSGQEKISKVVSVGQTSASTFDISGADSYAVVVQPIDGSGYIYPLQVKQPD